MENAVYWQGQQVGIECAGRILWFTSAPKEAIAAYTTSPAADLKASGSDEGIARNLGKVAQ